MSEGLDSSLTCGIRGHVRVREGRGGGTEIHHDCVGGGEESRQCLAGDEESARQIHGEHLIPQVQRGLVGVPTTQYPGGVDQYVQSPESRNRLTHNLDDGTLVTDIDDEGVEAILRRSMFCRFPGVRQPLLGDVGSDHAATFGEQPQRGGLPDSRSCAGDENTTTFETIHCCVPFTKTSWLAFQARWRRHSQLTREKLQVREMRSTATGVALRNLGEAMLAEVANVRRIRPVRPRLFRSRQDRTGGGRSPYAHVGKSLRRIGPCAVHGRKRENSGVWTSQAR